MKTALSGILLALATLAALGAQSTEPPTPPANSAPATSAATTLPWATTRPTTQADLRRWFPLPKDLSILAHRSIFLKGNQRTDDNPPLLPGSGGPSLISGTPESLIFNGAIKADGQLLAFLEDSASGQVAMVRVGQSVAEGTVAGITLESLNYASHGKVVEVAIGHNLEGGVSPLSATRPTEVGSTTAPSNLDDVIQKMKARHDRGE